MTAKLEVSVVIPTHNRWALLSCCLAALSTQTLDADRFEVVVVADGCTDSTVERLRARSYPFRIKCLEQPASGVAAARNLGAREALGRLLIFLDDDVVPSRELVAAHVAHHADRVGCVAIGPYPSKKPARGDFLGNLTHHWWNELFSTMERGDTRPSYTWLVGGNFSIPAQEFRRVGGFSLEFPACGVEDYELGARLIREGVRLEFSPLARAIHLETYSLDRAFERALREGFGDTILASLHPDLILELACARPDRLAQTLVFKAPVLGRTAQSMARLGLELCRRLRLERGYRRVYSLARRYWYWRGVADRVGTLSGWRSFVDGIEARTEAS